MDCLRSEPGFADMRMLCRVSLVDRNFAGGG